MQLLRDNLTLWTSDMQVRSWKVSLRYEDVSWVLANITSESSHCFRKGKRNSGHRLCIMVCPSLWEYCYMLIYTRCWELMNSVGSHGSLSLPFMMKVMVCHFVSDSHEVMTALIVVLPIIVVVEISLQLRQACLDNFCLLVNLGDTSLFSMFSPCIQCGPGCWSTSLNFWLSLFGFISYALLLLYTKVTAIIYVNENVVHCGWFWAPRTWDAIALLWTSQRGLCDLVMNGCVETLQWSWMSILL
jgi:hypothetical protein